MARRFNGFPAECIQDWTLLAESHGVYTSACITEDSTLVYRVFPVPIDRCVPSRHRGIRSYLFYVNQLLKTGYNRLGLKPILPEVAKVLASSLCCYSWRKSVSLSQGGGRECGHDPIYIFF